MENIYIVNYCSPGCVPLKSITQFDETNAFEYAKELSSNNSGTAFNRFGNDFKYYYPKRIRTEEWLYERFASLGGKPMTQHPVYFVVNGSDYLNKWFGGGKITKLLLNDIDSKDISFTFGDSMAKMDKPERKDPFLKETLFGLIEKYDSNIDLFINDICKEFNYIEAQLWNDKYFKDYIV